MKRIAFINADIYTPRRIVNNGVVTVKGKKITGVGTKGEFDLKGAGIVDVRGHYLVPGFVDIHVHGGGGSDFIDGTLSAVKAAARHHCGRGTTTLLAATSTYPLNGILKALATLRKALRRDIRGAAAIEGAHLEGPFLGKREPGAQNAELILEPTPKNTKPVMEYADILKIVTLAPEANGALKFIRRLAAMGICVSIGHSGATYEEVAQAVEAGARHVTHLWSAMSTVKRVEARRFAGVLEAALERDDLTTEIIADGRHLPTSLMRLAYKAKGPEKLVLVSDAMRAAGMPEGTTYEIGGEGQLALYEDGVGYTLDKKSFASSAISLDKAVRHLVQTVGISLMDTLTMASLTPARIAGVDDRKGSIAAGKDADLVILHRSSLEPVFVMARGQTVTDTNKFIST
jgi:N-acetylglucosamine-6-phosphate deacetylase